MIPGRKRRFKCSKNLSQEDSRAVMFRRKVVNTYSRACPRQVANKHHFLTPDTPVVEELELPSHLLRDSMASSTPSSARQNSLAELSSTSSQRRKNSGTEGRDQCLQSNPATSETAVSCTPTPGEGQSVRGCTTAFGSGVATHSREKLQGKVQLVTSRRSGLLVERRARDVGGEAGGSDSNQRKVTESGGSQAVRKRRRRLDIVSSTCKKKKEIGQQKRISRERLKTVSQGSSDFGNHEELGDGDSEVIDRLDIPLDNQSCIPTAPSCNLESVSMELTCSTEHKSHQEMDSGEVGKKGLPSLSTDTKIQFLKETIVSELQRMNVSVGTSPLSHPHYSTPSHSHRSTSSQQATLTSTLSQPQALSQEEHTSRTPSPSQAGSVELVSCSLEGNEEEGEGGKEAGEEEGGEDGRCRQASREGKEEEGEEERGGSEVRADKGGEGEGREVDREEEESIEVPRVMDEETVLEMCATLRNTTPLKLSPGIPNSTLEQDTSSDGQAPETISLATRTNTATLTKRSAVGRFGVDVRGLCGGIALRNWCSEDKSEREGKRARAGEKERDKSSTQMSGRKARSRGHSESIEGGNDKAIGRDTCTTVDKPVNVAPTSGRLRAVSEERGHTAKDGAAKHKRRTAVKHKEKCREQSLLHDQYRTSDQGRPSNQGRTSDGGRLSAASSVTVSTALCSHTPQTSGSATGQMLGAGNDLEIHFNHLKMTPIPLCTLTPTPTRVRSLAPLTSTPAQTDGGTSDTACGHVNLEQTPDLHPPTITTPFLSHHPSQYPLTSTPIQQPQTPNHPPCNPSQHLAALEREIEREGRVGSGCKAKSSGQRNVRHARSLWSKGSSGEDSTMQRMMEFDEVGFQASETLDLSPPPPSQPSQPTQTRSRCKTLLSKPQPQRQSKTLTKRSGTTRPTSGLKTTTSRPKSATHSNGRPTGTLSGGGGGGPKVVRCDQKLNKDKVSQKTKRNQGSKRGGRKAVERHSGSRAVDHKGRGRKLRASTSRQRCVVPRGLREWYHRQRQRRQEMKIRKLVPIPAHPATSSWPAGDSASRTTLSPEGCPECVLVSQSLGEGVERHVWLATHHSSWEDSSPEDVLTRALEEMM